MNASLLFTAVSRCRCFLIAPQDTESVATARSGFVSDAHRSPCLHAEESHRPLLDLLVKNAICQPTTAGHEKARSRDVAVAARVRDSPRVRDRLRYGRAVCNVREHVG